MASSQGLSAAARILPIIDNENQVKDKDEAIDLKINNANIKFKNVFFKYDENNPVILNGID